MRENGEKLPVMGQHPTDFASLMPGKRVFFVLTGEGRKPAETEA